MPNFSPFTLADTSSVEPAALRNLSRTNRVRLLYIAAELRCIADEEPENGLALQALADLVSAVIER